jgi:hypothetical protein
MTPAAIVLGQAGADFDRHGVIPVHFAALLQKFQGAETAFAANDTLDGSHDKVLQQAVIADAGRQSFKAAAVHRLARIRGRGLPVSATISATCIGCTFPPGDWDGVRKNEVTGSNTYSKIIARYRQDLLAVHAAWPATVKD